MGRGWDRLRPPESAVRHVSAARHITDSATQPGIFSSREPVLS